MRYRKKWEQTDMPTKLTDEIIAAAIEGFEAQKKRIDEQVAELRGMLSGNSTGETTRRAAPIRKRRKFSAAVRRKMALSQKARWAKIRGASEPAAPATAQTAKPSRRLSAAGRKAIQEALRRRWAKKRAEDARQASAKKKGAVKQAAVKAPPSKAAKKRTPIKTAAVKKAGSGKTGPAPVAPAPEAVA